MKFLIGSAAIAVLAAMPFSASAQLIGNLDNNTVLGSAIGAGLGGALGSNLAGSGQRQEGTAIGAALGGVAGYALSNQGQGQRYAPVPGYGGPVAYGQPALPYSNQVRIPTNYQGGFAGAPAYGGAPTIIQNGGYVAGPLIPVTRYTAPRVTYTLPPVVRVQREIVRKERVVVKADCPSGTTEQADGTCMSSPRTVFEPAPVIIPSQCPAGTTDQGNGTCLAAPVVLRPLPKVVTRPKQKKTYCYSGGHNTNHNKHHKSSTCH